MTDDIAIKVENLSKCYQIYDRPSDRLKQFLSRNRRQYYREFWALKDISFEIKKGESVAIIGGNGSGKSTLLQLICKTLSPSSGIAKTNQKIAALLELGSGFNPEFTGLENIYLNASILGLSREKTERRLQQIIEFADIGDYINQPVKTYSTGMTMRLAFSVIAHVDADVLVIDEALSVGDAVFSAKCNMFIRNFLKKGTLIFVSHDMQSVVDFCDRAIWMRGGNVVEDGPSKEVVTSYKSYVHQKINNRNGVSISHYKAESMSKQVKEKKSIISYHADVYQFDSSSSFWGAGGAEVVDFRLIGPENNLDLKFISGNEKVLIRITCKANKDLLYPIVGFSLRNKRGLELISENTSLGYMSSEAPLVKAGQRFNADFVFAMPYLQPGEYFFGAAVAEKTEDGHIQHNRRDECLIMEVATSRVFYGLFSMPIENCVMQIEDAGEL